MIPFVQRPLAGLAALGLVMNSLPVQAVSLTPIAHLSAVGGQYFTGATHSDGVNVDGSFVPVIGINSKLYLIPIYIGSFHQTQSVYTFLGENTLITKQMDHTGVLRAAWAVNSSWRIKPRVGYTKEWIQQSTDENLWNGLFNYKRAFGGISAERVFGNGSWELGYEHGSVQYPNYQALDSDPRLTSTGITQSAGTNVLNFNSHETSLIYQLGSAERAWNASANFTWVRENFGDQKVISADASGFESFEAFKRKDDVLSLALQQGVKVSSWWTANFGETFQYYLSNQNAFDGTQLFSNPFTYHYYNFVDTQLNPSVTFYVDQTIWDITVGGSYGYRKYSHRRSQDGTGAYQNELVWSMNRGGSLTVRYDLGKATSRRWLKGTHVVMTGNALTYWSNTRYEANYPYNYTVYSYLGGLSWDF